MKINNNKYQACIDACSKCAQACLECFDACLQESDVADRVKHIKMLVECALMCQSSIAMMSMDAQNAKNHCKMCAKMCEKCAKSCSEFDDEHCTECSEVCYDCAEQCKIMSE